MGDQPKCASLFLRQTWSSQPNIDPQLYEFVHYLSISFTATKVLLALADWGYLINLFNLLPIGSMDGGRVAATLSPWLPAGGLALGGGGTWEWHLCETCTYQQYWRGYILRCILESISWIRIVVRSSEAIHYFARWVVTLRESGPCTAVLLSAFFNLIPYPYLSHQLRSGWIAYEGLVANPIFYLILMSGAYTTGSRLMGYTEPPHEYRKLNSSEQVQKERDCTDGLHSKTYSGLLFLFNARFKFH